MTMATSDSEATESDGSDKAPLQLRNQLYRERPQYRLAEQHDTIEPPEGRRDALSMRAVIEEFRNKSMHAVEPPARDMTPPLRPRNAVFTTDTYTVSPVMCGTSRSGLVSKAPSRQRTFRAKETHGDSTDTDEDQQANEMELIWRSRLASAGRNRRQNLKRGNMGERYQILARSQQEGIFQPREHASLEKADESALLSKSMSIDMDLSSPTTPTVTASKRPCPSSCSEAGDETESDTETTRLLRRLYWRISHMEKERAAYLEREQRYQTQILNLATKVTQLEAHLDKARMAIMGPGSDLVPSGDRPSARPEAPYVTTPKQARSPEMSSCLPVLGQFEK